MPPKYYRFKGNRKQNIIREGWVFPTKLHKYPQIKKLFDHWTEPFVVVSEEGDGGNYAWQNNILLQMWRADWVFDCMKVPKDEHKHFLALMKEMHVEDYKSCAEVRGDTVDYEFDEHNGLNAISIFDLSDDFVQPIQSVTIIREFHMSDSDCEIEHPMHKKTQYD